MFSPSNKLSVPVLGMSLAAICTVLYLSPVGSSVKVKGVPLLPSTTTAATSAAAAAAAGRSSSAPGSPAAAATATAARSTARSSTVTAVTRPTPTAAAIGRPQVTARPSSGTRATVTAHTTSTRTARATTRSTVTAKPSPAVVKAQHCYDFKWQQDAQAAYLANLSDPWGLDAAAGPNNGDGLACTGWPVDPSRAASKPVGAYVPPSASVATKAALLAPALDYYGVAQDGLPGDSGMFNSLAKSAGKAPSAVGWFSGWDAEYGSDKVKAAWARQSLPVITWMSKPTKPGHSETDMDYSLKKIIAGDLDPYLYRYAGDVVRTNLPVVIRLDHEMNGVWYPWGAGAYNNTPAQYVAMWRHVWNIFEKVGANEDVMWLWSPARVDKIDTEKVFPSGHETNLAEDYPGDAYVDMVGATVYLRYADQSPDFATSFAKTGDALAEVSSRPIFYPEIGAIQTAANGTDTTAAKVAWTTNTLDGILADPRVIGFVWNNNVSTTTDTVGTVTNDWRFNSSAPALKAFKKAIDDPRFASGVMPDGS